MEVLFRNLCESKWNSGNISPGSGLTDSIHYLYDHPAGDKEVGGGERRPEEGSHHEGKNNAENKMEKHGFCA